MNIRYSGTGYEVTFDCRNINLTVLASDPTNSIEVNCEVYNNTTTAFEQHPDFPQQFDGEITEDKEYQIAFIDGIYKLTVGTDIYYLFNICDIIDCKVQIIKDTVCSCCEDDDCKAKAYFKLNEFNILWTTYLSMISQNLTNFDFVQDNLVPYNDLINIVELDKVVARLRDLCNDCEGFVNPCPTCS